MARSKEEKKQDRQTQIVIAIVGAVAVITAALIGVAPDLFQRNETTPTAALNLETAIIVPTTSNPSFIATSLPPLETQTLANMPTQLPKTLTVSTSSSIEPSNGIGKLLVRVPETCKNKMFVLKSGNFVIGDGEVNTEISVGTGTYDIVFTSDFINSVIRPSVEIGEEESITIDLTDELVTVQLSGYPGIDKPLIFYANTSLSSRSWLVGEKYCATLGTHKITFVSSHQQSSYLSSKLVTYGLFDNSEMTFPVEIKSLEDTIIGSEVWPKQLGLVSFNPPPQGRLSFQVVDLTTGEPQSYTPFSNPSFFWIPVGKYKIIMADPYPGFTFNEIEIKPGKETVLNLPE